MVTKEQAADNAFEEMDEEILAAAKELHEADEFITEDGKVVKKAITKPNP